MKKIALSSMIPLLLLFSATTFASDMPPGNVVPAEKTVTQGESFQITLPANPTTGYLWVIRSIPSQVALLSMEYSSSGDCAKGTTGCGGKTILNLTGIMPGKGKLVLQHARPWEIQPTDSHSDVMITVIPTTGEEDTFCQPADIQAHFDDRDGEFTGMSQRGVLLVMENTSDHTCRLARQSKIIFSGKTDKGISLQAKQRINRAMHPGPVLLPVILEPGHKHSVMVRWVAGDLYDNSHNCITTTEAIVNLADQSLHIPAKFQMCAPKDHTDFFTTGEVISP
jgi:predicted secreted protein